MGKQNIQAKRSIRCTQSDAKRRSQNKTFEASIASFPRNWTANRSAIFAFGVQSCSIHHGDVPKIDLYNFLKYSQFHTVAYNCHGKTKTLTAKTKYLTAKPKTSRQNQKPHGKNKIPHDKTKNLTSKPKTSRQNQILHSKHQIPHRKNKYPRQNQSYFAFSVKYLVLRRGCWFCREVSRFCREVFGFAVRFFVFLVRFLVLP